MKGLDVFAKLLDMTDIPMFCKNTEGVIIHANPAFAQLSGITPTSKVIITTEGLFDDAYQKCERESDELLIKRKEQVEYDITLMIGGIQKKYHCQKILISFDDNNACILVSMKEMQAMEVLNSFLDRLFLVVEYSPVSIIITDPSGTIQYVNQTFTKVTGYSKEEALGKNPRILKSGVQGIEFYENLWKTISAGNPWQGEFHNISKSGEPFWEIASISPILDRFGKITNYIAIKENITYLKNIQEELRKSEERNREILEAIPDIMVRLNKKGEILDQNLTEKINEVLPESERENSRMYIEHTLQTGTIQIYEYPLFKDGTEQYYEARFIVSGENEVFTIIRNITERIKAEKQIKSAREAAENANRAKSVFLATMSHEIRTPLHSISGFIELLKKTPLNEIQKDYLNIIAQSAENLLGIINNILDFSKIESSKMEIEHVAFNPFTEFEPIFELFAKRAEDKKISLYPYIEPDLPRSIVSDPLRIRQILNNLLSNAVKFTPEGGKIFLEIQKSSESNDGLIILFSVKDTGIGIPLHKRNTIFESFTQADSSITRKYGGTGLGLAISKNLVNLLGGTLSLESTPGKGSIFSFLIPVKKTTQKSFFKPTPNFTAYIYSPEQADSDLVNLLYRYCVSFQIDVKIISNPSETSGNEGIIFLVETPENIANVSLHFPHSSAGTTSVIYIRPHGSMETANFSSKSKNVLYTPISASKLFNCIIKTRGITHVEEESETITENRQHKSFKGNVLVAEDNQVNQKLIKLMLEEYELSVDIVNNGLDAYYQYIKKPYDLILMDINMPVTDGIEATRMIRVHEKEHAAPPIPIIALTAQAMKGDRERFLESGMTGYLAKPIEINKLEETLSSIFTRQINRNHEFPHTKSPNTTGNAIVYDIEKNAASLGIDANALLNIIHEFLSSSNTLIDELKGALKSGNAAALHHIAHRLKGAAANLRFSLLAESAEKIESSAKSASLETGIADIEKIKILFEAYKSFFNADGR